MVFSQEYMELQDFKKMLDSSDPTELYETVMNKEEKVLDTMNRVVNLSNEKELKAKEFLNMSLYEHLKAMSKTMKRIFESLLATTSIQEAIRVFSKTEHRFYTGVLVIWLSCFIFFVLISN